MGLCMELGEINAQPSRVDKHGLARLALAILVVVD